jgi:hypothetical protein
MNLCREFALSDFFQRSSDEAQPRVCRSFFKRQLLCASQNFPWRDCGSSDSSTFEYSRFSSGRRLIKEAFGSG